MDKKRILVKVPAKKEELFQTFPFFIALRVEFPEADVFIICEEDCSILFSFLPYRTRVFERPRDKINLMQTHHFIANLNEVFNIDVFFDLENSFNSAFMGFNCRAKVRVGFEVGWNKHLLTLSTPEIPGLPLEQQAIHLLEKYSKKDFKETRIFSEAVDLQVVEKVEALFKEPEQPKFIMLMLYNLETTLKEIDLWKSFFDGFTGQKFVIWALDDQDAISEIFSEIDLGKNQLTMHTGWFAKEMTYLFSKVLGVVTNNAWCEALCSYYGVDCISLMAVAEPSSSYAFYRYKPRRIRYRPEVPLTFYHESEDREFESINAVIDYLHFSFKL
jgi:hypothetical protein